MTINEYVRHLEECLEYQYMLRAHLDEKQEQSELEPAEAYWYGGCP